jgi:hypothetical protein
MIQNIKANQTFRTLGSNENAVAIEHGTLTWHIAAVAAAGHRDLLLPLNWQLDNPLVLRHIRTKQVKASTRISVTRVCGHGLLLGFK